VDYFLFALVGAALAWVANLIIARGIKLRAPQTKRAT
jgi:hypothetical protein